ncbi:MAG: hypothetical protein ACOYYI_11070 [Chloroflexota bacterium]
MNDQRINPLNIIKRLPMENLAALGEKAAREQLEKQSRWNSLTEREQQLVLLGAGMGAKEGWKHHASQLVLDRQTEIDCPLEALSAESPEQDEVDMNQTAIRDGHVNPIQSSIEWLIDQGFDKKQATNICRAIRADCPEKLWEDAPAWIEWCGKIKREYDCIVQLAAMGIIYVEIGPGGVEDDLRIGLKNEVEIEEN